MNRRRAPAGASLYRDQEHGLLLGVCAGLSDRYGFRLDALRILSVIALVLFPVATLLAYLVAGALLPCKPLIYYGSSDERELWRPRGRRVEA
jgi:phage shock protein C